MTLIQEYEERELFEEVVKSYERLHRGLKFTKSEEVLTKDKLGGVYYTFPGEESRVTFTKTVGEIKRAVEHGYHAPLIILRKKDKDILIDGHRRAKVAWDMNAPCNALVMKPNRTVTFGIENLIEGRIKDLW